VRVPWYEGEGNQSTLKPVILENRPIKPFYKSFLFSTFIVFNVDNLWMSRGLPWSEKSLVLAKMLLRTGYFISTMLPAFAPIDGGV
jgi:hypothetical protein